MSQNDISQLLPNMPTGIEGVRGLLQAYQKGTAELQRLLANEADVVLECRVCRNMFRSVINLTTHKKHYCKTKFTAATANSAALWEQFLTRQPQVDQKEEEEEEDTTGKREKNMLRVIRRKIQEITIPIPGSKDPLILPTLPLVVSEPPGALVGLAASLMAEKDSLRGKTAISFPQDPHARSKALKLRNPKENILTRYSAELPPSELSALHKISRFNPSLIDGTLKCLHPNCADVPPFKNFVIFGYHCGMKHSTKEDGRATCYLCNHTITKWHNYFNHYTKVHGAVKLQHKADREEDPEREKTSKRAKRSRSLSPDLSKNEKDEEVEEEPEAETGAETEEAPPVIEPIDLDETNGNEEDEDEAPPTLTRMSRNRFRTLRAREASVTPVKPVKAVKEKVEDKREQPEFPSRNLTPAPADPESSRKGQNKESNRKIAAEVQKAITQMLDRVQESMGEKIEVPKLDLSTIRLIGRKKKLRGRAAYNEKQRQLEKMRLKEAELKIEEVKNETPEPEEETPEDTPPRTEVDEDTSPKKIVEERIIKRRKRRATDVVFDDSHDLSAPRPSRAKKRPDWMESYLLDTDKGKTKGKDEEGGEPNQLSPPITPQKPIVKAMSPVSDSIRKGRPLGSYKNRSARDESIEISPSSSSATEPSVLLTPGSSRRKQDMSLARDMSEDGQMVIRKAGETAAKPYDLSTIPVLLSNQQKTVFFSGLKLVGDDAVIDANGEPVGPYQCEHCGVVTNTLKEGRRHMVSHIRVHRLMCSLCGTGAFFCNDMRIHLQNGFCENLEKAPFPLKSESPFMSKGQADSLTNISDPEAHGRVVFTHNKIISMDDPSPHYPDPIIEEAILGPPRKNSWTKLMALEAQKPRDSLGKT